MNIYRVVNIAQATEPESLLVTAVLTTNSRKEVEFRYPRGFGLEVGEDWVLVQPHALNPHARTSYDEQVAAAAELTEQVGGVLSSARVPDGSDAA